jgi:hypothetical protein
MYDFSETARVHFLKIYASDRRLWWYDKKADIEVTVVAWLHIGRKRVGGPRERPGCRVLLTPMGKHLPAVFPVQSI